MGTTPEEYRYYLWRIWVLPLKNMGLPLEYIGTTPEEYGYYPWRMCILPLKNMGLPLEKFIKIKASPPNNSIFFCSTPPLYRNVHNLPLENSMVLNRGRVDIKCKIQSPKLFYSESWHSSVLLRVRTGYFPCVTLHKVPQMLELYRSCWASEKAQSWQKVSHA